MSHRMLAVVTAGLHQPSSSRLLADRLTEATVRALHERGVTADVQVVELRDHAHDLMNNVLTGFPSGRLHEAIDRVARADGLIAVTPIFAASYSGLFKSFFDVLEGDALVSKPVLIGATGGTERHSLALEHAMRPLFSYLRSIVVPTAVYAATSDWGGGADTGGSLDHRIARAAAELAKLVAEGRSSGPTDSFDDLTPFEDLLAGN